MTDELSPSDDLQRGVVALRAGQHHKAVEHLRRVALNPDFINQSDLQDLRARVCSLLAQALFSIEHFKAADQWCRTSLRILRHIGDSNGQSEVRELQEQIQIALAAAPVIDHASLALLCERDIASILSGEEPLERLLQKGEGHLILKQPNEAKRCAHQLLERVDVPSRRSILALLLLSRAAPSDALASLKQALKQADATNDTDLFSTTLRTARQLDYSEQDIA